MTIMTLFALAAMGCVGNVNSDSNDTNVGTDPDDTSEPENYVTVDVTIHAAIDGEPIDPVGVCVHEASGNTGDEKTLAQAETTGKAIAITVLKDGEMVRPWIGPATSTKSSDGYRVLEFDGRKWVHPLADFLVSNEGCENVGESARMIAPEYCEPTVNLNGYFPPTEFSCVRTKWAYDASDPEYKGEEDDTKKGSDHVLEVTSGKDIIDPDDLGLDDLLANGCGLESSGSGFAVVCEDDYMHTVSSSWNGNGFTVLATITERMTLEYTCTVK